MRWVEWLCVAIVLVVASLSPALADVRDPAGFTIRERFPEVGGALALRENLYLLIDYDIPADGLASARAIGRDGRMIGISGFATPVKAGRGWFVTWISTFHPVDIAEIEVAVRPDDGRRPMILRRLPLAAAWIEGAEAARRLPPWVAVHVAAELRRGQDRATQPSERPGPAELILILGMIVSVPAYIAAQILTLRAWRGGWRVLAALPLAVTLPLAGAILTTGLVHGSAGPLPILTLFLSPPLLGLLLLLLLIRRLGGYEGESSGRAARAPLPDPVAPETMEQPQRPVLLPGE